MSSDMKSISKQTSIQQISHSGTNRGLMLNWYKKLQQRRIMHTLASRHFHRYHMLLGGLVVCISSITGGTGFGLSQLESKFTTIAMALSSMVVAALSAIQHFCTFEIKSSKHHDVAEDFENLIRETQITLRKEITEQNLKDVKSEFNCIVERAPIMPTFIANKYCDLQIDDGDGTELLDC